MPQCISFTKNGIRCVKPSIPDSERCKIHGEIEVRAGPVLLGKCQMIKTSQMRCNRDTASVNRIFCRLHENQHEIHAVKHAHDILEKERIDMYIAQYKQKGFTWQEAAEDLYKKNKEPTFDRWITYRVFEKYGLEEGATRPEIYVLHETLFNKYIIENPTV